MTQSQWRTGLALAAAFVLFGTNSAARAYTADQQQLCSGDAFRLCSSAIPDVDRVTACMIQRRAELSPGCAQFFHEPVAEPVVTPRQRARQPLRIAPRKKKTRSKS